MGYIENALYIRCPCMSIGVWGAHLWVDGGRVVHELHAELPQPATHRGEHRNNHYSQRGGAVRQVQHATGWLVIERVERAACGRARLTRRSFVSSRGQRGTRRPPSFFETGKQRSSQGTNRSDRKCLVRILGTEGDP